MVSTHQASAKTTDGSTPEILLVSYVGHDLMWAEWISERLQRAGRLVEMAEWEGGAEAQVLSTLEQASERYSQCITVLSGAYLSAAVPTEERGAAAVRWAMEHPGALTPVLVRRCQLPPQFWQLSPVDLHEITDEYEAQGRLLRRVLGRRAAAEATRASEPMTRFPGHRPAVWSLRLPARNPHFTGRDRLLRDLRRRLTSDVTALHSLRGFGGVGKTQLAIEYAHRFAADYDLVWWIPAEDRAQARSAIAELAPRLGIAPSTEIGELIRATLDALRTGQPYQRWMLIFDNAENPDDIRSMLLDGPGHILITSRYQGWDQHADVLDVDVYSRAESIGFMRRRVPKLNEHDAYRLAEELGDLPLALEHVAAWLAATGTSVDHYLTLLHEQATELLSTLRPTNYPKSVALTWAVSMNRLYEQIPAAADLLEICAFVGPSPIALSLFENAPADVLPESLGMVMRAEGPRAEALEMIRTYSLARVGEGPDGEPYLQQHRLVQALIRDLVSTDDQAACRSSVHRMLAAADPGDPDQRAHWTRYSALLPHLLSSGAISNIDPDVRSLVLHQIMALLRQGEYRTCLDLANAAEAAWQPRLETLDHDMFTIRRQQANALRGLGRLTEALQVDQKSYDLGKDRLGPGHQETLRAASGLAASYRRLGSLEPARVLDDDALLAYTQLFGHDHEETMRTALNVGFNIRLAGDFQTALALDQENAERYTRVLGPDSYNTMFVVNNIARDLRECGHYYESLAMQENTFARYKELFGEEGPDTLRAMKNLAVSRRKAGRYEEAWELAEDVLTRHRRRFGDLHPETLAATTNFANDCRCLGRYTAGKGFAEAAVRGYQEALGNDHGFTVSAEVNLAVLVRLTGTPDEARALNEQALVRLRQVFGENHRYPLTSAVNLASDLDALGQHEAARKLDEDTLTRLRVTSGEDHPYTLACALNLALDLRSVGERTAFRELFADVIGRYQRTLGVGHPEAVAAAARTRADCDIEPPPV